MSHKKISLLTERIDAFPTLPTVVSHVMEITSRSDSSVDDLMQVVRQDPSLTAAILKMANSAFYGMSREVATLKHAVAVLGFADIRNMVLSRAVFNSFKTLKKDKRYNITDFWEHSFFCSIAAKTIAGEISQPKSDFFIAGLIHDIGKLLIYMELPAEFFNIVEAVGPEKYKMHEKEMLFLGTTHTEIGMRLLKRWMFPEKLLMGVGFHHAPEASLKHQFFSTILYAADHIAHLLHLFNEKDNDRLTHEDNVFSAIIEKAVKVKIKWDKEIIRNIYEKILVAKDEESESLKLFLS